MSILLEGATRNYGLVQGVSDVSLELGPGITGILGPNGAGKSTLMKLVLELARPSLGRVRIDGRDPASDWELRSRFGFVPEYDCFYDHMTAREYVAHFLQLQGVAPDEAGERAAALLDDVGLGDAMERRIRTYSRGMRQKAKFARAIAHDPNLLVLDEPFQGTDPTTRRLLMELIRSWADAGRTILLFSVLHLLDMVGHEMFDVPQWVTVYGDFFRIELGWRTPFLLLAAVWAATASAVTLRLQRLEVTR